MWGYRACVMAALTAAMMASVVLPSAASAEPRPFAEIGARFGGERVGEYSVEWSMLVGADGAAGVHLSDHFGVVVRGHFILPSFYVLPFPEAHGGFLGAGGQLRLGDRFSIEAVPGIGAWRTMEPAESGEFAHASSAGGVALHTRVSYRHSVLVFSVSTTPILIDTDDHSGTNPMTVYDIAFTVAYHGE